MKTVMQISPGFLITALVASMLLIFTSCETTGEVGVAQEDIDVVIMDAVSDDAFGDVDDVSFEAMEMTDNSIYARSFSQAAFRTISRGCATITNDTATKTVTVDFGTGCLGPDGKTRSGQIVINYSRRLYIPGATRTVTLVNYVVDSVSIAGSKTYTNLMVNFRDTLSLNVVLTGGQITMPNGNTATRAFDRTSTWVRGINPSQDEFWVDGNIQGTRFNGNSFTRTVNSTLVYRRACRRQQVKIPVEGTATITRSGQPDIDLDFGMGSCDNLVDVTVNGQTTTVDVTNR